MCRQVYHEASAILYEKNGWVTLAAAESTITSMSCGYINSYLGFPGDSQAVTRYENDQLSRSAVLDIKAQLNSDIDPNMVDRVIPLAGMPRFCRLLTQYDSVQMLDLVLHFNHRAKDDHQSRLLGYLGQARELRRVKFTGIEPPWAVLSTIVSMTHPYTRLVEILSTVSAYQSSSKYQSNNGQTLAARNLVQDGVDFVDWWLDTIRPWMLRLEPFDETELDELIQARADMGFSCASLSIRLGSTDLAQTAIEHVLERLERTDRLDDIHKSSAHYHMAQKFEAVGWKNAALYSYLQALRLRPGYQDVDAAVDQMERSLGSGTALEDANVKHNIQSVLERFRYRPAGSAIIGIKEYRKVFQQFIGTAAEINSLNRTSRVEVSRLYRRVPDAVLITHRPTSYI